jgi:hypothetical protein
MPSPLTHIVPRPEAHPCRGVLPVPVCPGYTFGYTPRRRPSRSPFSKRSLETGPVRVWGGMTLRQRRALLQRRPKILSWRALFEADRSGKQLHAS